MRADVAFRVLFGTASSSRCMVTVRWDRSEPTRFLAHNVSEGFTADRRNLSSQNIFATQRRAGQSSSFGSSSGNSTLVKPNLLKSSMRVG
jgi:hypothetical protein